MRGFFSLVSSIRPLSDRPEERFFFIFETEPNFQLPGLPDSSSPNPEQSVKVELKFPLPGIPQSGILP